MFAGLAKRNPGWRFVLINDLIAFERLPDDLPSEVLVPARTGLDFLTRLCLAMEADAYIGPADVFGLAAYLARRPVHLLEAPNSPVKIAEKSLQSGNRSEGPSELFPQALEFFATEFFKSTPQIS